MNVPFITALITLFTITNPIGNLPLFLALTDDQDLKEKRRTAMVTAIAVAITLLVCLFLGQLILNVMGINIYAFKIAGMLIISALAWSMIHAEPSSQRHTDAEHAHAMQKSSVAVVPLAIPITAGGGAMAAVISFAGTLKHSDEIVQGVAAILATAVLVWLIYSAAPALSKVLKISGMNILTRVFGLLLLAIAITTITTALGDLFPILTVKPNS
jgi:multiple antibiotic resistance protein